jgi:2-polyprenyl-3-methyl-5-hydroxy-6-metoxy-1,4-benzoquinol methylase
MIEWKEHKLYSYADYEYRLNQWKIIQLIKKYTHDCLKVLDVGCGTGNLSQDVKRYFPEVYGVDIDPVAAKEAKKKIDVIIASAEFLPFRKDVFDAVISNQVIEHVMNVDFFSWKLIEY